MKIDNDELAETPIVQEPNYELDDLEGQLEHLDHTIEHAWEAARAVERFGSGIVDIAPIASVEQDAFRW
jgi:hypothetical protein